LSTVDTAAVRNRYRAVWHPGTVNPAAELVRVLGEVPGLCIEIERLARLLGQARCAYANLTAAGRAALAARAEGEADPWWYLRDELGQHPATDPGAGLGCGGWCR
jgi:hypothetical protein